MKGIQLTLKTLEFIQSENIFNEELDDTDNEIGDVSLHFLTFALDLIDCKGGVTVSTAIPEEGENSIILTIGKLGEPIGIDDIVIFFKAFCELPFDPDTQRTFFNNILENKDEQKYIQSRFGRHPSKSPREFRVLWDS